MAKITYISSTGEEYVVNVDNGLTAMKGAVDNSVPGIDGDCGGQAACGTCHVYVDPAWVEKIGPIHSSIETEMLALIDGYAPNSRLSCQINISDDLDGLVLRMPAGQH